ncbi:septum formation family protein [Nocardioides sp. CN2-186]|uniref:septum formation family protein n=1 Tax=Nocardioides tweenelious TaxID=3156607 RepID=UPI0032B380F1
MIRLLAALPLLLALTACTSDDASSGEPTSPASTSASSAAPSAAPPPPAPANRSCHDLAYDAAVAPTDESDPVPCTSQHTAMTFSVGDLDTLLDGHLLAVDSERVQSQVATTCPARFATFVGGTLEERHLSMLRAVWFTPTVEESDAGASWFRCDVVALARDGELAPLTGRLAGVLAKPEGRDRYAMCGTAEPGTPKFQRVICSSNHSWRAISTVPLKPGRYPGEAKVRAAGQTPCQDAGAAVADSSLDYQWGYEWPSASQWAAGQHYGLCWAPD